MALATSYVATVCAPAGPVLAEPGDPDPGGGNATTSTTATTSPAHDRPGAVADEVPAGATPDLAPTDLESALLSRDQRYRPA